MPPDNLLQLLQSQMSPAQAVSTGVAHSNIDNLEINTEYKVADKEDLLMKQLTHFFNNIKNINKEIII